jgi:tetratricopeptide (TPR) repeat protein
MPGPRSTGRRTPRAAWYVRAAAGALIAAASLALPLPALAAEGSVHGMEMSGFGRAVFQFDDLPKASVRVSSGILILTFDRPIKLAPEKLALELPSYVSAVRIDPDGKGMRLALAKTARPSVMEAGDKLFLDLLPETWRGMPPSLPPDVVEELSRRAREADEAARRLARRKASEEVRELNFKVGTTPTFSRLVFEMPVVAPVEMKQADNRIELTFDSAMRIDAGRLKAALPGIVLGAQATPGPVSLTVALDIAAGVDARGFREDDTFVLDLAPPKPAPKTAGKAQGKDGKPVAAEASPETPSARGQTAAAPSAAPAAPPVASGPATLPLVPFQRAADADDRAARAVEAGLAGEAQEIKVAVAAERGSVRLALPLLAKTPVAVFERGGWLWIAAESAVPFEPSQIGAVAPGVALKTDVRRVGRLSILRLALARPMLVRAAATDKEWIVTLGDEVVAPSAPLLLTRGVDREGRTVVTASFPGVAGVHWVEDPEAGDRIAVVTGRGQAASLLKAQGFVDFQALPTAQGLAIVPVSDDVAVRAGIDDVSISRDGGLSVSFVNEAAPVQTRAEGPQLVLDRDQWARDRKGSIRETTRALMRGAADANRSNRSDARLALARAELAGGLALEALGTLNVLAADDTELAKDRGFTVLNGVAMALAGRSAEANKLFSGDPLRDDPEAVLWRAYTDAQLLRWPQALVGFRRSSNLVPVLPDDLQARFVLAYAEAAVEARDFGLAQRLVESLAGIDQTYVDKAAEALLNARIAEGQGRLEEAFAVYDKLAKSAARPVEAKARLLGIALALKDRTIDRKAAIAGLETLSVSWRGDDVEARTLGLLGRLYAEEERWRDAFTTARRATTLYPDHEATRSLYDEAGSRFESLFLDGKADSIPRLDAVALYFDFKEFTPPGRRGDEMIRRLSERLVTLDLLGEAADLLSYQVEHRLSGAARANVATRLAVIQLMNRQPAKAYQALRDSRMAEMPGEMRRARLLLEARALSDLSRTDLALEMIDAETGADVERLRADILWQSRRWREAGEVFERMVGDRWQGPGALDDRARADVMRAAIAYGLADEALSLERLRAKFAAKMGDSADAKAFSVVTSPGTARAMEYRDLARSIASADTLAEFLSEYRKRYPDTPNPPGPRRPEAPPPQTSGEPPQGGKPAADAGKESGKKPS